MVVVVAAVAVVVVAVAVAVIVSFVSNRMQQWNSKKKYFVDISKHIESLLHSVSGQLRSWQLNTYDIESKYGGRGLNIGQALWYKV